jgi:hypothetical protein
MPKLIVLAATCLLSAACARPDYAETWPGRFDLSAGAQPGYAIKRVVEKQGPVAVIAGLNR